MRLLIVEDDAPLAEGLAANLRLSGYAVDWLSTADQALAALAVESFDAVVLDLNLPDADGLTVLRQARSRGVKTPVLILSARDEIEDRVQGLNLGADDYLIKPFDLSELEARLRVLIRRAHGGQVLNEVTVGQLTVDLAQRRAFLRDHDLGLTAREFTLLQHLALRQGQVMAKDLLLGRLVDFDQSMSANAMDILVHRVRKKLDGSGVNLRTLRGLGYLLEAQP